MKSYRFAELVDVPSLRKIAEANFRATGMPMGIIDATDGSIVVGVGWQDICTNFHRVTPAAEQRCRQSDTYITKNLQKNTSCAYKCANGLWDIGIPIIVDGKHLATLFLGQFFYDDEVPDRAFFQEQAVRFGFDVSAYLAALDRVPKFSRGKVQTIIDYDMGLAGFLAESAEKVLSSFRVEDSLRASEERYRRLHESMTDAFILADMQGHILETNRAFQQMIGYSAEDLRALTYTDLTPLRWHALEERIVAEQILPYGCSDVYEKEYIRKGGEIFPIEVKGFLLRDEEGLPVGMWGIIRDLSERKQAEKLMRVNEQKFQALFGAMSEMVVLHELVRDEAGRAVDYRIVDCNAAFSAITGISRDRAIGALGSALYADGGAPPYLAEYANVVQTGISMRFETFYEAMQKHFVISVVSPSPDIFATVTSDITDRKMSEKAIATSEEKFRLIFDNSPFGLVLFDDASVVLDCNQALANILGAEKYRYIGMNLMETLEDPLHRATIQDLFQAGQAAFEGPYTSRITGKQLYVSLRGIRIGPKLFLAIIEDITERKTAEQARRESEDRFRATFEAVNDAIFIHEVPSGRVIDVNQRMSEMYGYDHDEALQLTSAQASSNIPPYTEAAAHAWLQRAVSEGPQTFEWQAKHKDGHLFWTEVSLRSTRIGVRDYIIATVRDVTGRKLLEEQLRQSQKMEAVGVLAGGVAHDFNNILQAIMSSANLIKLKFRGTEALQHIVDDILTLSERAADLTRGLLAFSRKQVIAPRPQDLNELVRTVTKLYTRLLGEDIDLRLELHADRLGVNVDDSQMQQVLLNLLTNARDAMPTGGTLTIRSDRGSCLLPDANGRMAEKPCAVLTIQDTGQGIEEKDLARIFEPFYTTKEVGKGTGLGLSVAYGIVQQHGGTITVSSSRGSGTTFAVMLPLAAVQTPGSRVLPEAAAQGAGETILLVEDDQQVREATASILEAYGYTVIPAATGAEAIELHRQNRTTIRLALLDVIMPGMNGEQVYEVLAAQQPDMKVIFLSGYPKDVLEQRKLREVMYLPKPVIPADLIRTIRAVLAS